MHTIRYTIHDPHRGNPQRIVEVDISPEELERMAERGYLVRERFVQGETLEALRAAADRVEAAERTEENLGRDRTFGGFFARHLEDKERCVCDHALDPFLVGLARAMLGPAIRLSQVTLRVTYPGEPGQETCWHIHRRVIPEPMPPWFSMPHTVDFLLYLDDTDRASGPLVVMPGSHRDLYHQPQQDDHADKPGQQVLELPAGSLVAMHSNLWHRGMPTTPAGHKRRLLLTGFFPAWFRESVYGVRPADGITRRMLADADEELRELLGQGGFV